jgi:hypothetical protein
MKIGIRRGIFSDAISLSIGEIFAQFPAAGLGRLGGMLGGIMGMGGMPQGMNRGLPNQRQTLSLETNRTEASPSASASQRTTRPTSSEP